MLILTIFLLLSLFISTVSSEHARNKFEVYDLDLKDRQNSIIKRANGDDKEILIHLRSQSAAFNPEAYHGLIVSDGIAVTATINGSTTNIVVCAQNEKKCVPATKMMEKDGLTFWKADLKRAPKPSAKSQSVARSAQLQQCKSNENSVKLQRDKEAKVEESFICTPACNNGAVIFCKGKLVGFMLSPRHDNHGQIYDLKHLVRMIPKEEIGKKSTEGKPSPTEKSTTSSGIATFQTIVPVVSLFLYCSPWLYLKLIN